MQISYISTTVWPVLAVSKLHPRPQTTLHPGFYNGLDYRVPRNSTVHFHFRCKSVAKRSVNKKCF